MRKVEVVVLCEDDDHFQLVYGYLTRRRGYNRRQIHSNIVGSYSNVLKEYPNEVRAQRARANHTSACLIVVIDRCGRALNAANSARKSCLIAHERRWAAGATREARAARMCPLP